MNQKIIFPEKLYYRYHCIVCGYSEWSCTRYQIKRCPKDFMMMYAISQIYGRDLLKKGGETAG